jgi:hypothetical protein
MIRVNGGGNRVLAEKGIVMMQDCKEDLLYAVFEFPSFSQFFFFFFKKSKKCSTNNESDVKVIFENIQ